MDRDTTNANNVCAALGFLVDEAWNSLRTEVFYFLGFSWFFKFIISERMKGTMGFFQLLKQG